LSLAGRQGKRLIVKHLARSTCRLGKHHVNKELVMSEKDTYAAGMAVRRKILGDEWVDRANANTRPYNRGFQDLLTRYGWGEVWTRPGLQHHTRRVLVLGTMVALGKWDEFRMHARPALLSGNFSLEELTEVILQQAIYCGLPAANTAFHELARVLDELEQEGIQIPGSKD
jgi:alkylhydroperoxidase/carboxymuconolactone decarboxylase family protein YurZ